MGTIGDIAAVGAVALIGYVVLTRDNVAAVTPAYAATTDVTTSTNPLTPGKQITVRDSGGNSYRGKTQYGNEGILTDLTDLSIDLQRASNPAYDEVWKAKDEGKTPNPKKQIEALNTGLMGYSLAGAANWLGREIGKLFG